VFLAMFSPLSNVCRYWRQKATFKIKTLLQCSQHCSTFVPIGKYCPIIIVKGEVDRDDRTRVLAQEFYVPLHYIPCRCSMGYK
jgi:hypothetical protein